MKIPSYFVRKQTHIFYLDKSILRFYSKKADKLQENLNNQRAFLSIQQTLARRTTIVQALLNNNEESSEEISANPAASAGSPTDPTAPEASQPVEPIQNPESSSGPEPNAQNVSGPRGFSSQTTQRGARNVSYRDAVQSFEQKLLRVQANQEQMLNQLFDLISQSAEGGLQSEDLTGLRNQLQMFTSLLQKICIFGQNLDLNLNPNEVRNMLSIIQRLLSTSAEVLPKVGRVAEEIPAFLRNINQAFGEIDSRLNSASAAGELKINELINILAIDILPAIQALGEKIELVEMQANNANQFGFVLETLPDQVESISKILVQQNVLLRNSFNPNATTFEEQPAYAVRISASGLAQLVDPQGVVVPLENYDISQNSSGEIVLMLREGGAETIPLPGFIFGKDPNNVAFLLDPQRRAVPIPGFTIPPMVYFKLVNNGGTPSANAGVNAPPLNAGFSAPQNAGVNAPPANAGFNDPINAGFNPAPVNSGFNPAPVNSGFNPFGFAPAAPVQGGETNSLQIGGDEYVLDNSSRTFSYEPNVQVETSFSNTKISPEIFGISTQELASLKTTILPLLKKLKRNEQLSENEVKMVQSVGLDKISFLMSHDGSSDGSGLFDIKNGAVVRVILSFKDTSILNGTPTIISSDNDNSFSQTMDKRMLNSLEYKSEFFFIVIKNDESLTMDQVLDALYQHLFRETIANLVNNSVYLESIQIQQVYPTQTKYGLIQKSFGAPGRLSVENFPTSPRAFCFVLSPSFMSGPKNKNLCRIYGVSSQFANFHGLGLDVFETTIGKTAKMLQNPILIGRNSNLILKLAVKTRRMDLPVPYVPIATVSVGGFLSNANPQNKIRSFLPITGVENLNNNNNNP
jgi:hypothetical protein